MRWIVALLLAAAGCDASTDQGADQGAGPDRGALADAAGHGDLRAPVDSPGRAAAAAPPAAAAPADAATPGDGALSWSQRCAIGAGKVGGPDYDQFNPKYDPDSCSGTNAQDITGVEKVVFLGD